MHKSNDSKMDIKILALTNDLKIVKNILVNGNQGNYSHFINENKSDNQREDNTKSSDKNITSLNVKLDGILKEFNVLKSYRFEKSSNNEGDTKLNEIIKKIDLFYQK